MSLEAPEPDHRIRALAGVLAGFRWPERGTFEQLKKAQREAALTTARDALRQLSLAED